MANSPKSSSNPDEASRNPVSPSTSSSGGGGGGSNGHGGDSRLDRLEHDVMFMKQDIAVIKERLDNMATKADVDVIKEQLSHMPTRYEMVLIMGSMLVGMAVIIGSLATAYGILFG